MPENTNDGWFTVKPLRPVEGFALRVWWIILEKWRWRQATGRKRVQAALSCAGMHCNWTECRWWDRGGCGPGCLSSIRNLFQHPNIACSDQLLSSLVSVSLCVYLSLLVFACSVFSLFLPVFHSAVVISPHRTNGGLLDSISTLLFSFSLRLNATESHFGILHSWETNPPQFVLLFSDQPLMFAFIMTYNKFYKDCFLVWNSLLAALQGFCVDLLVLLPGQLIIYSRLYVYSYVWAIHKKSAASLRTQRHVLFSDIVPYDVMPYGIFPKGWEQIGVGCQYCEFTMKRHYCDGATATISVSFWTHTVEGWYPVVQWKYIYSDNVEIEVFK